MGGRVCLIENLLEMGLGAEGLAVADDVVLASDDGRDAMGSKVNLPPLMI